VKRRPLLLGALAAAVAAVIWAKPRDRGENHSPYFEKLSEALDATRQSKPTLVVDKSRLLTNVSTLKQHLQGRFDYRVVVKSLPSLPLLEEIMTAADTRRLMLFHQPFINKVAAQLPDTDILLGKPMPVAAAKNFYAAFAGGAFDTTTQLRWLLDTPERARQYAELAASLRQPMQACVEIDVGLHRGGIQTDEDLIALLDIVSASEWLSFAGFMGYEPHIAKVPGNPIGHRDKAMAAYSHYIDVAKAHLGAAWPEDALLNAGGSPTYQYYNEGDFPFNELAAGSCLVKPTDFDLPSLADHRPASYIATPVLKTMDSVQIPGINIGPLQGWWNPNQARSFFTYGGWWKAKPESPAGLVTNGLYGRSTNQEMLNGSQSIELGSDDWIFLRPTQSEFVFLQFGDIAVYDDGAITDFWPVFTETSA